MTFSQSLLILTCTSRQGGGLGCNWAEARVMTLAWNDRDEVLYIGGECKNVTFRTLLERMNGYYLS